MANRYWVTGGDGNWNSTTNWSATSGGASGASVPVSTDAVLLNASSGSGTVTLDISPTIQTLTCTGFTGTLAFGTNTISLNSTGTIFTGATTMTVTGTPLIICTNSSATSRTVAAGAVTEANSISFRVTAGTGTFTMSNSSVRDLDFTDGTNPTGFAGLYSSNNHIIYGSLTASTGMTVSSGITVITFAATSGIKTINTAGVTFDRGFTFTGVGGTWSLQSALTLGSTRTVTLTNGTLTTNGYALTVGLFSSSNSNTRTLNLGSSTLTLTGTGTIWNFLTTTGLTFNSGTSTITTTGSSASLTFAGGALTYYNVTFGASYYNTTLSGVNTFNNLTLASPPGPGRRALSLSANQTVNGTLTAVGSSSNSRPRITGNAGGSIITAANVSLSQADLFSIIAAGASSPWSGTNLGDGGENNNITFATPKTVYWNQPAGGNWSDVAWALTSGGTVNAANFPLGQDTVILDNTGINALSTIVMDYAWLIGSLNASSLTNALTINWNCFGNLTANTTGNVTLSSAITISYTSGAWGIDSSASTSTITTAGVIIPIATVNFNTPGNRIILGDNFTATGTSVGLVAGTLDLNGNTLSCNIFDSTFTDLLVRTIAFNGGQINITGNNATVWACENLTNFSYTGTPTVNLTYSGSTGSRTIQNGSTTGGTEANAVDINIVAGSDLISISNTSVVRNFTVQPAFTGQTGLFSLGFIYGNLLLSPSQTVSATANATTFAATSGTKTITTNGVTIDRNLAFNGIGGSWVLNGALTLGPTNGTLYFYNGTFSTANYNVTALRWYYDYLTVIGTVVLNLGSSIITLNGSLSIPWQMGGGTGPFPLTVNGGTSNIVFNSTAVQSSFNPNNAATVTYYTLTQAGTNNLLINDGVTLNTLQNTAQPTTITFNNTVTESYIIDNFNVSGTAGNLVTLASKVPGSQFLLVKPAGGTSTVSVSFCSITDSDAYRTGYWFALASQGNVDGGNNRGWYFAPITRISQLPTKAERQAAKLALAAIDRAADGKLRSTYDITQLPTVYSTSSNVTADVIDNPNTGGLVYGRPWI